MIDWKDNTSYRQGERGKVEPRVLENVIDGLKITIHRHKDYKNTWLLTCYKLNMEQIDLRTDDFNETEKVAIKLIVDRINSYLEVRDKLLKMNN